MTSTGNNVFRDAFHGVMTVVTAREINPAPLRFTANFHSSDSLDPAMFLVCLGRWLSGYEVFAACTHFEASVLAKGQEGVSNVFSGFTENRLGWIAHSSLANGMPGMDGASVHFSCRRTRSIPAADQTVLLGQITEWIFETPAIAALCRRFALVYSAGEFPFMSAMTRSETGTS